jgi:hypothetical protein
MKKQPERTALIVGVLLFVASTKSSADAPPCPAHPNNLTNGTKVDANQVMGNFNTILSCANTAPAPLTNPTFAGSASIQTAAAITRRALGMSTQQGSAQ